MLGSLDMLELGSMDLFEYVTVENSDVELPCYIERGHPYPNITWYRSSSEVSISNFHHGQNVKTNTL